VIKAILLVEDNLGDARLLREMLNEQAGRGLELTHVDCLSAAEKYLPKQMFEALRETRQTPGNDPFR